MGLLPFGLNANEMKVPFTVPVDFSKKGTVYETDFQAPWNMWGSLVEFYMSPNIEWETSSSEEFRIAGYIRTGEYSDAEGKPIQTTETPCFKFKVTLMPLGFASDNVTIWSGAGWFPEMTKKEFKNVENVEFIASVPLYGWGSTKTIMIADLQRLSNYHIKIESLEDVELPKDVKTIFGINRFSSKH